MKNKNKDYIAVDELMDTLEVPRRTITRWIKSDKISDEHYRYEQTPGRGRPRLEIDPAGLPGKHRQVWVMAQIEDGAWGERDPEMEVAKIEVQNGEWMGAAAWRREEAKRRRRLLRAVPEDLALEAKKAALDAYGREVPEDEQPGGVSYGSLRKYRKAHDGSDGGIGGMAGLLPKKANRKGKSKIRDDDYERYRALYLTEDRRTARRCYMLVRGAAVDEGRDMDDFPCARTFKNQLQKREDPALITFRREGAEAYYQKESPYISLDYDDVDAGDVYVADHRQLDVFVRDEEAGQMGRPWLTCWMDMRSWKIVAWEVYIEHPNSDRIHLTFKRAVSTHGLCRQVYIDNGKDFRCLDFAGKPRRNRPTELELDDESTRAVLEALGVQAIFALPYNARAKPVERRFKTFIDRLEKFMPAYAGSKPTERPSATDDRLASGDVMPLAEFEEHFAWAVEHVNTTPMEGKLHAGRTPEQVWQAEREEVRRVNAAHLAKLCLRTTRPRQIRRCELKVTALDDIYRAEWMESFNGTKTFTRYDPEAPEKVWVFRADDNDFLGAATPKPAVARIAETDEEREQLEAELAKNARRKRELKAERAAIEDEQLSMEELKTFADAAQAERRAEREAEGTAPTDEERQPDRSTLIEDEATQAWIDEAERQEKEGLGPLPYDPDELDDDDEDDDDDWAMWPDEL